MKTLLSKTLTALTAASLLFSGHALAQNREAERDWHNGPPSVESRLAHISETLDLSDQQALDMLRILQEQEQNRAAIHEQTMALMAPEICAQRAEAEDAILSILDEEQTARFLEIQEERQARAKSKNRKRMRSGELNCPD